jgi:hypothetical protein
MSAEELEREKRALRKQVQYLERQRESLKKRSAYGVRNRIPVGADRGAFGGIRHVVRRSRSAAAATTNGRKANWGRASGQPAFRGADWRGYSRRSVGQWIGFDPGSARATSAALTAAARRMMLVPLNLRPSRADGGLCLPREMVDPLNAQQASWRARVGLTGRRERTQTNPH